jgi:hypothetical protein
MRPFYLIAAIVGLIVPWSFVIIFFLENGADPVGLLQAAFANDGASAFTMDLLLASIVFWPLVYREAREKQVPCWWLYVVVNLCLGLCVALPLFLYVRQGRIEQAATPM